MSFKFDSEKWFCDIAALYRADEGACLERLFPAAKLAEAERIKASGRAARWIEDIRYAHRPLGSLTDLLARFGLSSQEGLALMCLAEALLRIPDRATADALIRDKLNAAHWNETLGENKSWALNATGWALALTGKIINLDDPTLQNPGTALGKLVSRLGQPIIREAIKSSMAWLASQFVLGQTIKDALALVKPEAERGVRFSFDMLGEGARTSLDAERYYHAYADAIKAIGVAQKTYQFQRHAGISVKLSALHPRYEMTQRERIMRELVPRLAALCEQAAGYDIPLTIDAEEADRLQLSIEVAIELFKQTKLGEWEGLGFAVQAYQKRAPAVINTLAALARAERRRLGIRLVKGAYWDSEISRAQMRGWDDFPVFTRKPSTDVSYLACAQLLLSVSEWINPVFGTHNAMTIAHILELTKEPGRIEFERLHGMGDDLYRLLQNEGLGCCVYAPVGDHDVLLSYLVRRILENGANSSFVHRLYDRSISVDELTSDPVETLQAMKELRHPLIRRAPDLYQPDRRNSSGIDLADPFITGPLLEEIKGHRQKPRSTDAYIGGKALGPTQSIHVTQAFDAAQSAFPDWSKLPVNERACCLEDLGDLLEQNRAEIMALLIQEAGKTISDAHSEVREATDFCRYYAARARECFAPLDLPGPTGEQNQLHLVGRGVFVCISPWNFPLAIFLGQITAALVSGNCVIAKPAPQTPLIAACVTRLLYQANIPQYAFSLLPGGSDIGAALIAHPGLAGVAFTGSTETARLINRTLAGKEGPIVPFIAETGGQNAMIVDSSALAEQVINDVLTSSFRSAGQRCSALRILCLQDTSADKILTMLKGAMQELRMGDPGLLETDVGPVIDQAAQKKLLDHVVRLKKEAKMVATLDVDTAYIKGTFVAPQAWEIPSINWLKGEVFGPILHVVRYRANELDNLIREINATGFGLTGGIHSRIETTVRHIERDLNVGNLYVNRSMIGAVVGTQPFGGEGLSGTGPKAGGPYYLLRFTHERVTSNNLTAAGDNASLLFATSEK